MSSLIRFGLPTLAFIVLAAIVASFAGTGYAVVTILIGLVIVGGLAAGYGVAKADDAPFAESEGDDTAAGDTPEHSTVSSAVSHAPH